MNNQQTKQIIREGLRTLGATNKTYTIISHVLHGQVLMCLAVRDLAAFDALKEMQGTAFRLSLGEV